MNAAIGEAQAVEARAKATAIALELVASVLRSGGKEAEQAASLRLAEQHVAALSQVAKESTTLLLPSQVGDPAAAVATALGLFQKLGHAVPKS